MSNDEPVVLKATEDLGPDAVVAVYWKADDEVPWFYKATGEDLRAGDPFALSGGLLVLTVDPEGGGSPQATD